MDRTGSWDVFVQQGVYQELVSVQREPPVGRQEEAAAAVRLRTMSHDCFLSFGLPRRRSVTLNSFLNTSDSSSVSQRR